MDVTHDLKDVMHDIADDGLGFYECSLHDVVLAKLGGRNKHHSQRGQKEFVSQNKIINKIQFNIGKCMLEVRLLSFPSRLKKKDQNERWFKWFK